MNPAEDLLGEPNGLADRLRALRLEANLSGKELADRLSWQASKVSRLENGKQMPTREDLLSWADACRASAGTLEDLQRLLNEAQAIHLDWKRRLQRGQAPVQLSYLKVEQESRTIKNFEMTYVPGLLQIPGYARRVLELSSEVLGSGVPDLDAAVTARLQRQQVLYDVEKSFEFLLAEPVLRWLFVPRQVMLQQLDRLQTVIGMPRVRFGILPLGQPLATAPRNSMHMYDDVALVENVAGEIFYRGEKAEASAQMIELLWTDAVTGEDARRLLIEAANDLRSQA